MAGRFAEEEKFIGGKYNNQVTLTYFMIDYKWDTFPNLLFAAGLHILESLEKID